MRTLIFLFVLFQSSLTLAHTCEVTIRTEWGSPQAIINTEKDPNCGRAVQRCLEILREDRYRSTFGCYVDKKLPDPEPQPRPQPQPAPQMEGPVKHRVVQVGEKVIFNSVYWTVTASPDLHFLDLKSVTGNRTIRDVARWYVAITEGCYLMLCGGKRAIEMRSKKFVQIEGIEFNGNFIYKDLQNGRLTFNTPFTDLARTEGCAIITDRGVCVGNRVIGPDQIYSKVIAVQPDNKVVLERESNARLVYNIDPLTLTVVR